MNIGTVLKEKPITDGHFGICRESSYCWAHPSAPAFSTPTLTTKGFEFNLRNQLHLNSFQEGGFQVLWHRTLLTGMNIGQTWISLGGGAGRWSRVMTRRNDQIRHFGIHWMDWTRGETGRHRRSPRTWLPERGMGLGHRLLTPNGFFDWSLRNKSSNLNVAMCSKCHRYYLRNQYSNRISL